MIVARRAGFEPVRPPLGRKKSMEQKYTEAWRKLTLRVEAAFRDNPTDPAALRGRYRALLHFLTDFSLEVGAEPHVYERIIELKLILLDIDRGAVHPVLVPPSKSKPGRRPEIMQIWQARTSVALGVGCLLKSGLDHEAAMDIIEENYGDCNRLVDKRGNIRTSPIKWYEAFEAGNHKNGAAQALYNFLAAKGKELGQTRESIKEQGHRYLTTACELASSLPVDPTFDPDPDWWDEEMSS